MKASSGKSRWMSFLSGMLVMSCSLAAQAENEQPPKLKMSGYLEAGALFHSLSGGYGVWNGVFVRGALQTNQNNVWNAELVDARQFDDRGLLMTVGLTHTINDDWFASVSAATSSGGITLPRLRLDAAINRKWLEQKNLVTTLGITAINAKDGHSDRSMLLAASYYFPEPWIVEGGIRFNQSNPGGVNSNAKYVAVTYGRDKWRFVSLRYGFGEEAYQIIGPGAALANFNSNTWTLTWREWLQRDYGFQVRVESYQNPSYGRQGIELSLFKDF